MENDSKTNNGADLEPDKTNDGENNSTTIDQNSNVEDLKSPEGPNKNYEAEKQKDTTGNNDKTATDQPNVGNEALIDPEVLNGKELPEKQKNDQYDGDGALLAAGSSAEDKELTALKVLDNKEPPEQEKDDDENGGIKLEIHEENKRKILQENGKSEIMLLLVRLKEAVTAEDRAQIMGLIEGVLINCEIDDPAIFSLIEAEDKAAEGRINGIGANTTDEPTVYSARLDKRVEIDALLSRAEEEIEELEKEKKLFIKNIDFICNNPKHPEAIKTFKEMLDTDNIKADFNKKSETIKSLRKEIKVYDELEKQGKLDPDDSIIRDNLRAKDETLTKALKDDVSRKVAVVKIAKKDGVDKNSSEEKLTACMTKNRSALQAAKAPQEEVDIEALLSGESSIDDIFSSVDMTVPQISEKPSPNHSLESVSEPQAKNNESQDVHKAQAIVNTQPTIVATFKENGAKLIDSDKDKDNDSKDITLDTKKQRQTKPEREASSDGKEIKLKDEKTTFLDREKLKDNGPKDPKGNGRG